ncbi:tyrosine-type recombinase/integrase [Macrococcus equipercicus]|uniref:Site-specific integrase n=1 Tax=Macrococcus equipercicus TaxID=69967 RepID=A0A9Q9F112_9STAP|nr:site-specific integrase [Macrococcus equipercicus]UTH13330.1 site-specific integrase [Macrococcus equipercicus]
MKVNQRGSSYEYYFRHEGQRFRKGGFKTSAEAKKAMKEKVAELAGGFNVDEKTPFVVYMKEWIRINKKDELAPRALQTYYNALAVFEEKFGRISIGKITQMRYRELLKEYGEGKYLKEPKDGRTTDSVKKLNMCLRACFNDAVNEGLIVKNPAYGAKPSGKKDSKPEDDKFIQKDMFIKLSDAMTKKNEYSYLFIYILCITGARFGEVQNLKYDHFNYKDNTLHLPGTKTESAARTIPLLPSEMKHIKKTLMAMPKNMNGFIFYTGSNLITHNSVTKVFKNFCLENKLGNRTLHSLRHTHASVLLSEGVSITYISKRLGHKDINITLKVYSHLLDEHDEQERQLMIEKMTKLKSVVDK